MPRPSREPQRTPVELYVCRVTGTYSSPQNTLYVAAIGTLRAIFNSHVAAVGTMWCRIRYDYVSVAAPRSEFLTTA